MPNSNKDRKKNGEKNSHLFPTKQMRIYVGGELGVGLRLGGRYIDSLMEGTGVFLSFFFSFLNSAKTETVPLLFFHLPPNTLRDRTYFLHLIKAGGKK